MRTIQTAVPTADLYGLPLLVEQGLAESHHCPSGVPEHTERYRYFPQVEVEYNSLHVTLPTPGETHKATGEPCESWPEGYFERIGCFASKLVAQYAGQRVVCFSHAASVALVASLLQCPIHDVGRFAPCGIFELRRSGAEPWELVSRAQTNPHVLENSPSTFPWTFSEEHQKKWPLYS